jgi:two-component system chemotaxis response regulator CheV
VFKVREVMRTPPITAAPEMPGGGRAWSACAARWCRWSIWPSTWQFPSDTPREIMIVTEYNGHTQGFLVEAVDTILRLDWAQMRVPPRC